MNTTNEAPSERLLYANYKLFQASMETGHDDLIRAASEIFSAPVVYVDEYFQIFSRYPKYDPNVEQLLSINNQQEVLPEKLWSIFNENLTGAEPFYEPFYSNKQSCEDMPSIFGEVVRLNEVRGHVIVCLGEVPFREEDLAIAKILTELLRAKVERRSFRLDNRAANLTASLQLMLSPETSTRRLQQAVTSLESSIRPGYQVMVTVFESVSTQRALADYTVRELRRRFPEAISVNFENSVVTLISGITEVNNLSSNHLPQVKENPYIERFFEYMDRYQLVAGLSNTFKDISKLRIFYRQALLTARMVLRLGKQSPAYYRDYLPLSVMSALLETEEAETFIPPVLYRISDYDAEHGTDNYPTLRKYVAYMKDKNATAAAMGVHLNTLRYRLSRIEELFGLNLDDPKEYMSIMLGMLMWEVANPSEMLPNLV